MKIGSSAFVLHKIIVYGGDHVVQQQAFFFFVNGNCTYVRRSYLWLYQLRRLKQFAAFLNVTVKTNHNILRGIACVYITVVIQYIRNLCFSQEFLF